MDCKQATPLMHEYLDGDLVGVESLELRTHLLSCVDCKERFRKLEQTVALLRSGVETLRAPDHVTTRIMLSLPPIERKNGWIQWIRRHPAISVASVFLAVMLTSFLSLWNAETDLVIKGDDLSAVVIQGNTVRVPPGTKLNGSLYVENGTIQVDGEVEGNIVVIDGTVALASTAYIGGEIQQVDELAEWILFKMNQWIANAVK
jgi:anti-sigma factor RsiW